MYKSSSRSNVFLNPFHRHLENTSLCYHAHTATLLIIYNRIDSEKRSQSENGIRDRMLVYLTIRRQARGFYRLIVGEVTIKDDRNRERAV